MVSTDDEEIAEVAKAVGAEVPFLRSKKAADDHATLAMVMEEVLGELKAQGKEFDIFCCILPTACFCRAETLQDSYQVLSADPTADSVMPIVDFEYPVPRALKVSQTESGADKLHM